MRRSSTLALPLALFIVAACGSSNSPSTPSSPTAIINEVRVGVAGAGRTVIEPGKTAQLYAQAVMSDGSTQDVTNLAVWQTSNPAVATVGPTGLVATYLEGDVTITASYTKAGTLALQVKKECSFTLDPASHDSDAFGGNPVHVNVTSSLASCSWTVTTSVLWVRIVSATSFTGSGGFDYSISGNSTPASRTTDLVVSGDTGATATHHIKQAAPASCSYVVTPDVVYVGLGGGSGSFRVDTTPDTCRWTAISAGNVYATNASSYNPTTGDFTVQYSAFAGTDGSEGTISICGLSGSNPCGVFTVKWRN